MNQFSKLKILLFCVFFISGFLMWGNAQADYTCAVPADGTFAECAVLAADKTGIVTINISGTEAVATTINMSTWSASSIIIQGQGRDNTSVNVDVDVNWTVSLDVPIEIKNITFANTSSETNVWLKGSPVDFKIHDNTFQRDYDTGNGVGIYITWQGAAGGHPHGIIYHNNLNQVQVIPTMNGNGDNVHAIFTQEPPLGIIDPDRGTVYIEGNTWDRDSGYYSDGNNGARIVYRFNDVIAYEDWSVIGSHGINQGTGPYNMRGMQMWEIYNNNYQNQMGTIYYGPATWTALRSGTGVIWGNKATTKKLVSLGFYWYIDRAAYSAPPEGSIGLCNGNVAGWDGNQTIDSSYSVNRDKYGATAIFSGTHKGNGGDCTNNCATLIIDVADGTWTENSLAPSGSVYPGTTVYKVVDGEDVASCAITSNTAQSITCTLSGSHTWNIGDDFRISDGYPCRDQIGWAYDNPQWSNNPIADHSQILRPVYIFENINNETAHDLFSTQSAGSVERVIANRDFYTMQGASCVAGGACTTGVGAGSVLPTSCTAGVGFWRTDERKLYKCTATNTWTEYYSPATCPHPLTGLTDYCDFDTAGVEGYNVSVSGDITPPASPTGLAVT